MCEPISATMAILSAAGTAANIAGQLNAGADAKAAGDANAHEAELAAQDAARRGRLDAGMARQEGERVAGQQKAAFGASGVDPSVGSPLSLMADTRVMSELDAQNIRFNAEQEAATYRRQGRNFQRAGERARTASQYGAAGAFLGGASNIAGIAYNAYNRKPER
jgi:hypothetical protein